MNGRRTTRAPIGGGRGRPISSPNDGGGDTPRLRRSTRRVRRAIVRSGRCAAKSASPDSILAISTRASPMSRSRVFGSRSRQRASSRRSAAGASAGSASSRGPVVSTAASVSEHVSPSNSARAGQHLVEHDAERPDVRALVDGLARAPAPGLMYAAVPRIMPRRVIAGVGHASANSATRRADPIARVRLQRLCQTEVEHLDRAVGADLDVRGLQIAMDDPLLVRGFERVGDLPRDRQRLVERDRRRARSAASRSSPSTSSITSAVTPSRLSRP